MVEEARLEAVESGLVPATDGWFVVNVSDAAWLTNDAFGARCIFEADTPVVRGTEITGRTFADLGIRLTVVEPGQPSTLYHAESSQEDFLVLSGECVAIIEGEERHLHGWDFVHCPPWTNHIFVGAGEGPCVIVMTGSRAGGFEVVYPVNEVAAKHGASVLEETSKPADAYSRFGPEERSAYRDGWLP